MSDPSTVALVTGGGRGLGPAIAETLSRAGVAVGLVGRNPEPLEEVAARLEAPAFAVAGDVTSPEMVQRAVRTVEAELGPIDLLVNSAGLREPHAATPWETDPAAWWQVMEVNVHGPVLLAQAVLPGMLERGGGRILELASGVGLRPEPRYSAYSVSKAALLRWVDNLAEGLGSDSGVHVLAASPGLVRTDMTEEMWGDLPDSAYGSVEPICTVARRFAGGELDVLHGWYVHAAKDDLDRLLSVAGHTDEHARRMRLQAYGEGDPLA
jgi:3-oxoacyl-[acyl-carrier protein] reductase